MPGAFARFMGEAAATLAGLWGSRSTRAAFAGLPIILVAYSGGYDPAAYALTVGGVGRRIRGVILLDALVGEDQRFASWIAASHRSAFFFSGYSGAAAEGNADVMQRIRAAGIRYSTQLPEALEPGEVVFLPVAGVDHDDFVTSAWVSDPMAWLLARIDGFDK